MYLGTTISFFPSIVSRMDPRLSHINFVYVYRIITPSLKLKKTTSSLNFCNLLKHFMITFVFIE